MRVILIKIFFLTAALFLTGCYTTFAKLNTVNSDDVFQASEDNENQWFSSWANYGIPLVLSFGFSSSGGYYPYYGYPSSGYGTYNVYYGNYYGGFMNQFTWGGKYKPNSGSGTQRDSVIFAPPGFKTRNRYLASTASGKDNRRKLSRRNYTDDNNKRAVSGSAYLNRPVRREKKSSSTAVRTSTQVRKSSPRVETTGKYRQRKDSAYGQKITRKAPVKKSNTPAATYKSGGKKRESKKEKNLRRIVR